MKNKNTVILCIATILSFVLLGIQPLKINPNIITNYKIPKNWLELEASAVFWKTTDVISTESSGSSSKPSLAVNNSLNIHIAWQDGTDYAGAGGDWDIFYKFWDASAGTWNGNINATDVVSTESTGSSVGPSLAVDGSGNVHVAWSDTTNYSGAGDDWDIFYKFWNASVSTWKGNINLTDVVSTESSASVDTPSLAVDGSGNVHIAWQDMTDYEGAGGDWDIFYKFWNASAGTWSGNINMTDVVSTESSADSYRPTLAVDSSGNIHIAWADLTDYESAGGDWDIFYKFWNASAGTWSGNINKTDVVSTESAGDSYNPSLAVNNLGNIYVVWVDTSDIEGAGGDSDIFYKFWNALAGTWNGNINATDVVSTESSASAAYPSLAIDGSGNLHVVWRDLTNYGGAGADEDIFYKFWNTISGVWSGRTRATDVVSAESASDSSFPSLIVDGSGKVHVAWSDSTNYKGAGGDYDIFYKYQMTITKTQPSALPLLLLLQPTDIILPIIIVTVVGVVVIIIVAIFIKKRK